MDHDSDDAALSVKKQAIEKKKHTVLPLLSSDLFSILVQTVMLAPSFFLIPHIYSKLVNVLYLCHLHQVSKALQVKWDKQPLISTLKKQQAAEQVSQKEEEMEQYTLTFLRRVALFTQVILGKSGLQMCHTNADLLQYLGINKQLFKLEELDAKSLELVATWEKQLEFAVQGVATTSYAASAQDYLNLSIQMCAPPRPFQFVHLPRLYQTLFFKHHEMSCSSCGKKLACPAVDLIRGNVMWIKQCTCKLPQQISLLVGAASLLTGECTKYCRRELGGNGVFLLIPFSTILVLRDSRKSVLPSPYFDQFGEEDRNLKRGVPLYLDEKRYQEHARTYLMNSWDQDTLILQLSDNVNAHIY